MNVDLLLDRRITLKKTMYGYDAIELTRRKSDFNKNNYIKKYSKGDTITPRAYKYAEPNINDDFFIVFLVLDDLVGAHWIPYEDKAFELEAIEEEIVKKEIEAQKNVFQKFFEGIESLNKPIQKTINSITINLIAILLIIIAVRFLLNRYLNEK